MYPLDRPLRIRSHINPETGRPHYEDHGVTLQEIREVLAAHGHNQKSSGNSRTMTGRTQDGRLLVVVYSKDPEPRSVYAITAYPLEGSGRHRYRRQNRRKNRRS